MIKLDLFTEHDFPQLTDWVSSEELLVTIAGSYFTYPLNEQQLKAYLLDANSFSFNIVNTDNNKIIGHAELYKTGVYIYKIDKLIIGDMESRGKGFCLPIIKALIDYGFNELNAKKLELNVFDWNVSAIKCYEKAGFMINKNKTASFKAGTKGWTALNMLIAH